MSPTLRVAVAQQPERTETESDDDCLRAVRVKAKEAAGRRVELLVFPEMSLTGYSCKPEIIRRRAQPRNGPLLQAVAAIALDTGVAICVGYAERPDVNSSTIYNALTVVDACGTLAHHYRKTHLYGADESVIYTAGSTEDLTVSTLSPSGIRIGALICMDCEYPEPARLLALQGAQLILIPTALGAGPVDVLTPTCVIPTRALENHVHIAYCNYNGSATSATHPSFCGRSAIVGPDGIVLGRAPGPEAHHRGRASLDVLVEAQVQPEAFECDERRNPYLTARRPDLYTSLSQPLMQLHSPTKKQRR
jgi:predicted amidohydrolase